MNSLRSLAAGLLGYQRRRQFKDALNRCRHFGIARYCPCCGSRVRHFLPFGVIPRPEAQCPICGSLERHRLIYLYLRKCTDLFDGRPKSVLHIAPEPIIGRLFRSVGFINYVSADLAPGEVTLRLDVTRIPFCDDSFDVIYCSHVLEHVPDDRMAMKEFRRVLKPSGWAILQVPITSATTFEDTTVTSPTERERLFGQQDHVRRYGLDYRERLEDAGFAVTADRFLQSLSGGAVRRMGLPADEPIFFCLKRPS